ncbi:MAG: hypothetical protein OXM01_11735 [Gemmatimonadota bacterium]|nr:hypothetical protein [Gemmatimonadota bacterium]
MAEQAISENRRNRQQSDFAIACGQLLVADGDSWFDYPWKSDIVSELEDDGQWAVLSAAHHGDTLEEMVYGGGQLASLYRVLSRAFLYSRIIGYDGLDFADCRHDVARDAIPKAILLSAGGNDILGGLFPYLLEHGGSSASDVLNARMVAGLFYRLERILVEYISAIGYMCYQVALEYDYDRPCGNIPVIIHGYDFAQANGRGYELFMVRFAGPWITPALRMRGRYAIDGNAAIRSLVNGYNDLLCRVAVAVAGLTNHNPVYYLDFRDVVGDDWEDEIHPNVEGAKRLAEVVSQVVVEFHSGELAQTSCNSILSYFPTGGVGQA